ncbi:riboflavin synthase [Psychrilyobacter sp.]|uniref:riboflavin synthase n=1 Tax=Psychrilyobacter sp. TaxID=2586924 RepID=UPI0030187E81
MFTGLVEEMGEVIGLETGDLSLKITVRSKSVIEGAKLGDSIATNGTCLTATKIGDNYFEADIMHESVKRTNLKRLRVGDRVNLEKSLTLATPLGGHLVTGDVDGEGMISNIYSDGIAKIYVVKIEPRLMKYVVEKGRITLDGASLTVVDFGDDFLSVSLIPHTQEMITLGSKSVGDYINVETDLIGKYVERMMTFKEKPMTEKKSNITESFLAENGFY